MLISGCLSWKPVSTASLWFIPRMPIAVASSPYIASGILTLARRGPLLPRFLTPTTWAPPAASLRMRGRAGRESPEVSSDLPSLRLMEERLTLGSPRRIAALASSAKAVCALTASSIFWSSDFQTAYCFLRAASCSSTLAIRAVLKPRGLSSAGGGRPSPKPCLLSTSACTLMAPFALTRATLAFLLSRFLRSLSRPLRR
mmetsp:Transcript_7642/g.15213  ORF Transcript_7642/g.15213 Transcript_7642/m.15213 type:complete len:200 (-) Transcript_7642:2143-2742(-)